MSQTDSYLSCPFKTGIDFAQFGLKSGVLFNGTKRERITVFFVIE